MKKSYIFGCVFMAATQLLVAQDSNDSLTFESFSLGANDFYNGSDLNGAITINDIQLSNVYTPEYSSWMGFSVSKVQDITTTGFGNQYASFANGGADNSEKYAVFYSEGSIEFNQYRVLNSIQITNTTYAGLTMRDGDAFTKAFGSPNGIDGQPDGTNGEDWLLLQLFAQDENNNTLGDTIDFYLADYRFADNSQDYIINNWERISLQNLVGKKLGFKLSSSDNGNWGMNTPAYFAIDNLISAPTVGIENVNTIDFSMYPNPVSTTLSIETNEQASATLINTLGQIVLTQEIANKATLDLSNLPAGLYQIVVKTEQGSATKKIAIQ